MIIVKQYQEKLVGDWNAVLEDTAMATFLHSRSYMAYHRNRFDDFSLVAYVGVKPVALLPANRQGAELLSHQGLTYGGFIFKKGINQSLQAQIIEAMLSYCRQHDLKQLYFKPIPKIFGKQVGVENLVSGYKFNQIGMETTLAITLPVDFGSWSSSKRWRVRQGQRAGLQVQKVDSFSEFWNSILEPNLRNRFGAKPVHSLEEIQYLAAHHPIHQWNVYDEGELVGGMTIYVFDEVAHAQYTASSPKGRRLNAIDFLVYRLCEEHYAHKKFLNLGTSHEQMGRVVKEGLFYWKSRFGAVPFEHEHWRVDLE